MDALDALTSEEQLIDYCRARHGVELRPVDGRQILKLKRKPGPPKVQLAASWIQLRLARLGYFVTEHVDPAPIRFTCLLHWPWKAGLPIPWGKDESDAPDTIVRSGISRRANAMPTPIDRVAARVVGGGL